MKTDLDRQVGGGVKAEGTVVVPRGGSESLDGLGRTWTIADG